MVRKPWIESDNKSPFPKSLQCGEGKKKKKKGFVRTGDKWSFHIQKCFIFAWVIVGLSKSFKMPHILALGTESLCQKPSFLKSLEGCIWAGVTRSHFCHCRPRPRSLAAGDPAAIATTGASTWAWKPAWVTPKWYGFRMWAGTREPVRGGGGRLVLANSFGVIERDFFISYVVVLSRKHP